MTIPPSFQQVLKTTDMRGFEDGHKTITMSRDGLIRILQQMVAQLPFDEAFYRATYSDVEEALTRGEIEDAHSHYLHFGYFEGRLPHLHGFDAQAYIAAHDDLSFMAEKPEAESLARAHFIDYGYAEGRALR